MAAVTTTARSTTGNTAPFVRKHTDRLSSRTARDARGPPGRSSAQRNVQISAGFVAKNLPKD